jgi:hypothetical protein
MNTYHANLYRANYSVCLWWLERAETAAKRACQLNRMGQQRRMLAKAKKGL